MTVHRKRLLVVDDDSTMLMALGLRLKDAGFEISCAKTGAEAISVFRNDRPDAVLLDLGLPDVDGFSVLDAMRDARGIVSVPVVVVTGRDASRNEHRARSAGAAEFFEKPVDTKRLAQSILRLTSGAVAA